jgi:hypothetical protein
MGWIPRHFPALILYIPEYPVGNREACQQRHISGMENGKRPVGKETAKRLGKALNISYKVFL